MHLRRVILVLLILILTSAPAVLATTPLDKRLIEAVESGDLAVVEQLLTKGASVKGLMSVPNPTMAVVPCTVPQGAGMPKPLSYCLSTVHRWGCAPVRT